MLMNGIRVLSGNNKELKRGGKFMKISELEERIDLLSLIENKYKVKKVGTDTYRITPCPVCGSDKCFNIKPSANYYNSFSGCCTGGSVYKYLMEVENMDEEAAYKELLELAGETVESEFNIKIDNAPKSTEPTKQVEEAIIHKDYTNIILELYNKQTEENKAYFMERGISPEIIDKYKLCIGDTKKLYDKYYDTRAILPVWENGKVLYWNARSLEVDPKIKYLKAPGNAIYFNIDHLKTAAKGETIIITEGEFDALSLETIGIKAIAIGGVGNYKNFIKDNPRNDLLILTAFDNDEKGQAVESKKKINIPKEYKDINDWIQGNKEEFKESIYKQIETQKRPDSLYNYMLNGLMKDISAYKEFKDRKTGFKNLDAITSLYPGLYVIGGLSTLGKTTFIHQMADQMAEMGEHILFFSLEMATLEMMTKSLSRLTVIKDRGYVFDKGVSALQIRLNDIPEYKRDLVQQAITDYEPISKRFNIIEGNFNTDVTTIRKYVDDYILINKVKPIIVIDYLQIIPGRETDRNDKERIDGVVTELKRISRDYNISVIVVSSLNRTNYLTPVDFESFKESGGIEYTADVVWGLQLQAIHDDTFNSAAKIKEKREIINEAKKATPRKIELVCLKNRNGISNYSCLFDYYPRYDLFISQEDYSIEFNQENRGRV